MKKKDDFKMNYSQIKSGIKKALSNSIALSGYSKDILERGGSPSLSLGLYSFALEEFGKSVKLSEIVSVKQKTYVVPRIIFTGSKGHDLKFDAAISTLPKECTHFDAGINITNSPDLSRNKTHEVGPRHESASIPKVTTGVFSVADILIDFQTRMNCFYLDWNEQKDNWKSSPKVLPELLVKSISEFEKYLNKKLDEEYDH